MILHQKRVKVDIKLNDNKFISYIKKLFKFLINQPLFLTVIWMLIIYFISFFIKIDFTFCFPLTTIFVVINSVRCFHSIDEEEINVKWDLESKDELPLVVKQYKDNFVACEKALQGSNTRALVKFFIKTTGSILFIDEFNYSFDCVVEYKKLFNKFYDKIHLSEFSDFIIEHADLAEDIEQLKFMFDDYSYLVEDILEKSTTIKQLSKDIVKKTTKR